MNINKNNLELKTVDFSTNELTKEAKALFSMFDSLSSSICALEKDLNDTRAYFPYKYEIKIDQSYPKKPELYHKEVNYDVLGYRTNTCWYLSWESDEKSKNFRLFLITEEKEVIYYSIPEEDPSACGSFEFQTKNVFKKALMETDLSTRLQYSKYLIPFINAFKAYLNNCRITIESGKSLLNSL